MNQEILPMMRERERNLERERKIDPVGVAMKGSYVGVEGSSAPAVFAHCFSKEERWLRSEVRVVGAQVCRLYLLVFLKNNVQWAGADSERLAFCGYKL